MGEFAFAREVRRKVVRKKAPKKIELRQSDSEETEDRYLASRRVLRRKEPPFKNVWLFGGHLGLEFAFANSTPKKDGSTRQGFGFGVSVERPLAGNWYFQPEVRYVQRGVNTTLYELDQFGVDVTGTIKLDSLQVPILFRYKMGDTAFRFFFFVGPAFSLSLTRKIFIALGEFSLSNRFRFFDIAMQAGGGLEFLIGRNLWVTMGLRYSHGIPDLDRKTSTFRTREIELSAGVVTRL